MPPKKNAKPKRRWILFKTLAGRMSFVIGMTAVFLCAAAVYGVSTFYLIYGSGITITSSMLRIAASTAFLAAAGVLTAKLLGEVLITRRVKKLALIAKQVIDGKAAADTLPYGLGELDHITAYFEKLATDLGIARDTLEKNVKLRTSVLELSKGISEIERARTTALLDSIGEGVIATDSDGKISFLNEVAKDALWWNPDAAMDVPIDSAFRLEDDKENVIDGKFWPIRKVLKDGKKITTAAPTKPYYLRCRDKSRFPVKMTISPLIVEKKVVGALATFNDITIEVEFDRKKSEFISIASHQLRSPATGIKMLTDMLRNGDLGAVTEKQKEWFDKLYAGSDRMLDLINEL
ncbi:MAG: histidine kinase dimerization/phospho-acceptor domain-containing protein, partial [Patescibacteria group bacterium]